MTGSWDPARYLEFADLRARPFVELLGRVHAERPRRVADLGCGAGNLTLLLRRRWPEAVVEAIDESPEMVAAARAAGVAAERGDVRGWRPAADTDVVVCNAVLHWVPGHRLLLRRWVGQLPAGAWLAVQVPGNFTAPDHRLVRELIARPEWAGRLAGLELPGADAVGTPQEYADLLTDAGCRVDAWETTYLQALPGPRGVLAWLSGSTLGPVRRRLAAEEWERFRVQLADRLAASYPSRPDGTSWLPFRRIFVVARTAAG